MEADVVLDWPRELGYENLFADAADGTRLRVVAGGPKNARRVLLLHGAPQFSYAWRKVMPLLSRDYRVLAPDLRGYGASQLAASGDYRIDALVGDVGSVLEATRERGAPEEVMILAHDWGGPIAWSYVAEHPEKVRHLVATNAPHPAAFARDLKTPAQLLRSWYIGLFQVPRLEDLFERTDAGFFLWMMRASSPPGLFSKEELEVYRACFARPTRPGAVLAYYRQAFRALREGQAKEERATRTIETPVTVVWGEGDRALSPHHPDGTRRYCTRLEVRRLPGVSHWVPEQRPEELARALRDGDAAA